MNRGLSRGTMAWAGALLAASLATTAYADTVKVSDLAIQNAQIGKPIANKSVDGNAITLNGQTFASGVEVHAPCRIVIDLHQAATRFTATIGVDDEVKGKGNGGRVAFRVFGDGRNLFSQPAMGGRGGRRGGAAGSAPAAPAAGPLTAGAEPVKVDLDVSNVRDLILETVSVGAISGAEDHAAWADATIEYGAAKPEVPALILTPAAPATPRINSSKVFGVHPGHPFLFTVSATGDRPMQFSAEGLPAGLTLDPQTGFISGKTSQPGSYDVKLHARNARGTSDNSLKIVVGDAIALTPQLGWNSWNCFGGSVTQANVEAAADAMVSSGLINHGWTYINVDDYWEYNQRLNRTDPNFQGFEARNPDGTINSNKRFPSMKGMADYIHGKGLKAGLYSGPGPTTCGGCTATYQHEDQDAKSWADWGFDYIKYDWCSYGGIANQLRQQAVQKNGGPLAPEALAKLNRELAIGPYKVLQESLKKADRDILYSLCQYGDQNVWEWGADVGGNSWRTTGDITDTWASLTDKWNRQVNLAKYAGPGHWNDPDMMIVGWVSVGSGTNFHPSYLTPNEQYTHVSLWCMLSAPLLIGCDMTRFDDFTLSLLSNDEILAVNQDPLGKQAQRFVNQGQVEIWARDLADGSKAVAFFNRNLSDSKIAVTWDQLGIKGSQAVRDLWRQKDVGNMDGQYEVTVPHHGAIVVKISPAK